MCLSIPAKVLSVEGEEALVSVNGVRMHVSIMLLDKVHPGDYLLVHAGFGIEIIERKEAEKTLEVIRHIKGH